ncbi:MAG: hypothetical protein FJ011_16155 [Chloroflexi bacterium]|nr:hypothetical protein [Chloroflexota bacterium]
MENELLWVIASALLAVAATNLAWLIGRVLPRLGSAARVSGHERGIAALRWLVAALFLLLPPLIAWRYGALSLYAMGLSDLDWLGNVWTGGPLTALIAALLVFGWLVYRRTRPHSLRTRVSWQADVAPWWLAPLDAALRQWHWAFYRAGFIGWIAAGLPPLGASAGAAPLVQWVEGLRQDPVYWGCWLGLGLVAVAWALNPWTRRGWRDRPEGAVLSAALAVATTGLFATTRNFWLCLACHVIAAMPIAAWFALAPGEASPAIRANE